MSSFKPIQIILFSFIPMTLVFIGVIGGSIHGSDAKKEIFPTPPPAPASTPRAGAESLPGPVLTYYVAPGDAASHS